MTGRKAVQEVVRATAVGAPEAVPGHAADPDRVDPGQLRNEAEAVPAPTGTTGDPDRVPIRVVDRPRKKTETIEIKFDLI